MLSSQDNSTEELLKSVSQKRELDQDEQTEDADDANQRKRFEQEDFDDWRLIGSLNDFVRIFLL